MRQIRQTWKGLLVALVVTSGILIACQKDAKDPSVTSAAKGATSSRPTGTCNSYEGCNTVTRTILAGQTIIVGDPNIVGGGLTVSKLDNGDITVTYALGAAVQYNLTEVHVYIGDGTDLIGAGNSVAPGQFPYNSGSLDPGTKTYTLTIPAADLATINPVSYNTTDGAPCYVIAAHAAIVSTNGGSGETAWGCGDKILATTGGTWAMSFTFCTSNSCTYTPPPTGPCALSQGYWLANTDAGQVRSYVNWGSVTFGSVTISQHDIVSKFPAKTNTLLKALFQATALQLDFTVERDGKLDYATLPADVKAAYEYISNTISAKGSLTEYLKITNQATIKALQTKASIISNFITSYHCGTAVYDTYGSTGTI